MRLARRLLIVKNRYMSRERPESDVSRVGALPAVGQATAAVETASCQISCSMDQKFCKQFLRLDKLQGNMASHGKRELKAD